MRLWRKVFESITHGHSQYPVESWPRSFCLIRSIGKSDVDDTLSYYQSKTLVTHPSLFFSVRVWGIPLIPACDIKDVWCTATISKITPPVSFAPTSEISWWDPWISNWRVLILAIISQRLIIHSFSRQKTAYCDHRICRPIYTTVCIFIVPVLCTR